MTSDDPKWMDQWDEGFAKLVELHPYMYKSGGSIVYPNKNQGALDLLSQGEIDMCPMWADMLLSQRAAGCPRLHQDGHHSALLHWLCAEHADSQFWFQP